MRKIIVVGIVALLLGLAALLWWTGRHDDQAKGLVLYGNIDLRQVEVAFNNSERIAEIFVQEGERVRQGQLLARLDTARLEPELAQAEAQAVAQRAVLQRLRNGSRPEEIAQARANVESAKAEGVNAQLQYERLKSAAEISAGRAVRQQDVDNAKASLAVAAAKLTVAQRALELALAGPRKEEIAEAEARLRAGEAEAALLRQRLKDSRLFAPVDGVVRSRVMEPGEMASPQRPVFGLAITDPKWVRVYVAEPDLGRIRHGMAAEVGVDSFPGRDFAGRVSYVSPQAEFTPKNVQTQEERVKLVFAVNVTAPNPEGILKPGMPADVFIDTDSQGR